MADNNFITTTLNLKPDQVQSLDTIRKDGTFTSALHLHRQLIYSALSAAVL